MEQRPILDVGPKRVCDRLGPVEVIGFAQRIIGNDEPWNRVEGSSQRDHPAQRPYEWNRGQSNPVDVIHDLTGLTTNINMVAMRIRVPRSPPTRGCQIPISSSEPENERVPGASTPETPVDAPIFARIPAGPRQS